MVETGAEKVNYPCEAEAIIADVRLEARQAEVALSKALADHLHGIGDADWNLVALRAENTARLCRKVLCTQRAASEALAKGVPDEAEAPGQSDTERVLSGALAAFPVLRKGV